MPRAIQYQNTYKGWTLTYNDELASVEVVKEELGIEDDDETEVVILQDIELKEEG